MNEILKTIQKQLHTFTLTDTERTDIRLRLAQHMHEYQPHRSWFQLSPYAVHSWSKRFAAGTAVFLVVLLTGGSGLTYASNAALPGDTLYTVKVATEDLQAAAKVTPEARADFEVKRAERRITEAVTLASTGKLDEAKKEVIVENLKQHTQRVAVETKKLKIKKPTRAVEVNARLAVSLEANKKIVDDVKEDYPTDTILVAIADEVDLSKNQAEQEKAEATEELKANETTNIPVEQLDEKKAGILLAMANWAPAATETASMAVATTSVMSAETTADSVGFARITNESASAAMPTAMMAKAMIVLPTPEETVHQLLSDADTAIAEQRYTDAFLLLQEAEDLATKITLGLVPLQTPEPETPVATETPILSTPLIPIVIPSTPTESDTPETSANAETTTTTTETTTSVTTEKSSVQIKAKLDSSILR